MRVTCRGAGGGGATTTSTSSLARVQEALKAYFFEVEIEVQ
jgi:hypothetical protein